MGKKHTKENTNEERKDSEEAFITHARRTRVTFLLPNKLLLFSVAANREEPQPAVLLTSTGRSLSPPTVMLNFTANKPLYSLL